MYKKTTLSIILGASLLANCSYYHEQQSAYAKAQNGQGIKVEPPLNSTQISDAYTIPNKAKTEPVTDAPPPPGSIIDPALKKAKDSNKLSSNS